MDKLVLLSQDKDTLRLLREYITNTMEQRLIKKVLAGQDVSGFKDANEIIKISLDEIDALSKKDKKNININQAE